MIFQFYDAETLTDEYRRENGIVTNRGADAEVTLELPDGAAAGLAFEIHNLAGFPLTIMGENPGSSTAGKIFTGEGHGAGATLTGRGSVLMVSYTGPHVWTGLAQGCVFTE